MKPIIINVVNTENTKLNKEEIIKFLELQIENIKKDSQLDNKHLSIKLEINEIHVFDYLTR